MAKGRNPEPEFDRRSAVVLGSPYWDVEPGDNGENAEEYERRQDEFLRLRDAIQEEANTYDDLSDEMKELFDRAEAAFNAAKEEFERQERIQSEIKALFDRAARGENLSRDELRLLDGLSDGYRRFTNLDE